MASRGDLPVVTTEHPCSGRQLLKPWLASLEDEVGGLDELSHDGDDGDLAGFFAGDELAGEGLEGGTAGCELHERGSTDLHLLRTSEERALRSNQS